VIARQREYQRIRIVVEYAEEFGQFHLKLFLFLRCPGKVTQSENAISDHDTVLELDAALIISVYLSVHHHSLSSLIVGDEKKAAGSLDPIQSRMNTSNMIFLRVLINPTILDSQEEIYASIFQ
jgi:hypothetical protein